MGVKPDLPVDNEATHTGRDDLHLEDLGRETEDQKVQYQKELEPDEPIAVPDTLLRVESLARVCSLSKILSQPKSRDLYETSEEEAESNSSPDAHLTKKLKDNGESPIPVKVSLPSSFALGSFTARSPCDEQESNMQIIRVGIYTRAERQAKLDRYRAKKNRRTFSKKILYACRKSFADSRPRVGGRFVPLKDLPLASKSPSPESDQEVSEMLASISANNKRSDTKKSGKKGSQSEDAFDEDSRSSSPDSSLLSPVSLSRSFPAPRVPLRPSYSAPASTSFTPQYVPSSNYASFDGFGISKPILAQHSEPSYVSPAQPNFSSYPSCLFTSFPASPPSARSSSARTSNFTRSGSRPSRSAIDDPSASLLLLSLAATQAAVS